MMKNKITFLNMITSLILQFVTIISGFIIPRIILTFFGSDVNGLVASLTQFLNYIAIVEGGITGVIMASLYKPLYSKDSNKISSIVKTASNFYKKIGLVFIIYTLVLAVVYPLVFNTSFSFGYVFSLTIILSLTLLIQYMFSLSLRTLLNADKKIYITSITQSIILFIGIILAYLSVVVYPSIHILKFITGLLFILQPVVFNLYIRKHYKLDKNAKEDKTLIAQRWDGFAINTAAFIHNGTDVVILTIFTTLKTVSVYSVYALVSAGLKSLVTSITSGINPTLGHALASENIKEVNEKMDLYEYIVFLLVFLLFTVGALLVAPFVMIYTKGITDTNYYVPLFGILLLVAEALYLLKFPHLNLAYAANKFKEITRPAFIEAGLNIIISIALVFKFGLVGVAIGTLVAMIYRLVFHVKFTKKIIPDRKEWIFYKKLLIFSVATGIGLIIANFIPACSFTVMSWITHAIIYTLIFISLYLLISIAFFKKELLFFKNYLFRKHK